MQTRHSNLIAMAHFLKTKTEPVLVCVPNEHCVPPTDDSLQYYKPWQLRPGDEKVTREQIEDAEATVAREVAEFETKYPPEVFVCQVPEPVSEEKQPEEKKESGESQQPKPEAEIPTPAPAAEPESTAEEPQAIAEKEEQVKQQQSSEPAKSEAPTNGTDAGHEQADAHHDDGGEVVEDNEDTVIY